MVMAKRLGEPIEIAKRIDTGLGSAAEFSRIKTAAIEVVRALAAWNLRECRTGDLDQERRRPRP